MIGFLRKLAGGEVINAVEGVANVIDKFVETDDERRAAETLLAKMAQRPGELQVELNKIEAGSRSIFVAGWRPAIGWVCATSLGIYYIPQFLVAQYVWVQSFLISCVDTNAECVVPAFPVEINGLMELIIGMLGLAGLRTVEKAMGKTK